jgi:hypothetical protein
MPRKPVTCNLLNIIAEAQWLVNIEDLSTDKHRWGRMNSDQEPMFASPPVLITFHMCASMMFLKLALTSAVSGCYNHNTVARIIDEHGMSRRIAGIARR